MSDPAPETPAGFLLDLLEARLRELEEGTAPGFAAPSLRAWAAHVRHLGVPGRCHWTRPRAESAAEAELELAREELVGALEARARYLGDQDPVDVQALGAWADWLRAGPPAGRELAPDHQPEDTSWTGLVRATLRSWLSLFLILLSLLLVGAATVYAWSVLDGALTADPRLQQLPRLSLCCPLGLFFVFGWTLLAALLHRMVGMRLSEQ